MSQSMSLHTRFAAGVSPIRRSLYVRPFQSYRISSQNQSVALRRCARRGLLWRVVSRSSCTPCCATEPSSHRPRRFKPTSLDRRPHPAPARSDARGREQTTARIVLQRLTPSRLRFQPSRPCTQLTPSSAERARREHRHPKASIPGRGCRP